MLHFYPWPHKIFESRMAQMGKDDAEKGDEPGSVLFKRGFAMKPERYVDDDLIVKKGISILLDQLGPVETDRFIALARTNRMESVKRHRQWQKGLVKESFLQEILREKELPDKA